MSMNLRCYLCLPDKQDEEVDVLQTPTSDTYSILGHMIQVKSGKKPRFEHSDYNWQTQAMKYLEYVSRLYSPYSGSYPDRDTWKRERQKIGDAWRRADEAGGRLRFFAA